MARELAISVARVVLQLLAFRLQALSVVVVVVEVETPELLEAAAGLLVPVVLGKPAGHRAAHKVAPEVVADRTVDHLLPAQAAPAIRERSVGQGMVALAVEPLGLAQMVEMEPQEQERAAGAAGLALLPGFMGAQAQLVYPVGHKQ
ncbi:MAG TPA: hypothetical protein VGM38_09375 [Pseudolysinimonas sp.]|jgi:hypothetical protein